MKFNDFPYKRQELDEVGLKFQEFISEFNKTSNAKEQINIINEVFKLQDDVSTHVTIASIRNSINTKDEFYDQEMKYYDEKGPVLSNYMNAFSKLIYNSKFKKELIKEFGKHMFDQIELSLKTFDEKIIPLLIEENKLSREYSNLIAAAQIEFEGKIYNLSQMTPFTKSIDRKRRQEAQLAVSGFFESKEHEIDDIYDKLVKLRNEIALVLGYDNFVQLGYDRMGRTDYDYKDVERYREQIKKEVVPAVVELNKRKQKRLNVDKLKSYDTISFLSGDPQPKGTKDELVKAAQKMYHEMSQETDEFFTFMVKHELFDLESKAGKSGGGYCTFIPKYEAPFIFANFNGTSGDVDVLTHEAGHAFQIFSSKNNIPTQRWPGMESAEIHSMSMEFFAWPWMKLFFKEDTEKYYFTHLASAISFLPYGALVDEFQYEVYSNPNYTPKQRKELWRKLERIYIPDKDYSDDEMLEKGTYWYRQGHIFGSPFYYIDYTLAQVCAFQYWHRSRTDKKSAWESYYHLCTLGGTKGFIGLLKEAGLDSPFVDGTIKKTLIPLMEYINSVDDTKF